MSSRVRKHLPKDWRKKSRRCALGSSALVHRIAERDFPARTGRAAAPWILIVIAVTVLAWWILGLPMEMRGMELGG